MEETEVTEEKMGEELRAQTEKQRNKKDKSLKWTLQKSWTEDRDECGRGKETHR